MTEWNSPKGKRRVVGAHPSGKLLVQTADDRLLELIAPDALDAEIKRDEANYATRSAARAAQTSQQQREASVAAELRNLHGFTDGMPTIKAEKIIATLAKAQGFAGEVLPRKVFIEREVRAGARVHTTQSGQRRLLRQSGSFFTERDVTATALDYAEYLIVEWGVKP